MKNTLQPDITAGIHALYTGDEAATRAYCGAYVLVRAEDGCLYRTQTARTPTASCSRSIGHSRAGEIP